MSKATERSKELISRVQPQAQRQADRLARRVPWPVLLESRRQYLDWQEFYYWARSIMESEQPIPEWLARRLDEMCPGFLSAEKQYLAKHPKEGALSPVRLGQWIDERIFGFAQQAGWLPAISYYAVREPRYQRASACWSETVEKWRNARPAKYLSLEEWVARAAQCDDTKRLLPKIRKERECFGLVEPARLSEAVSLYIDWEVVAYWARPALEQGRPVLKKVARELDARCPGFLEFESHEGPRISRDWDRLMLWISEHFFPDAKTERWYDAIVLAARIHPRSIRAREYADHCDEIWKGDLPVPYPSFQTWRRDADRYVDVVTG